VAAPPPAGRLQKCGVLPGPLHPRGHQAGRLRVRARAGHRGRGAGGAIPREAGAPRGPGARRSWSCRLRRRAGRWPAPWAGPRAVAACRCMPGADVPVARRSAPALSLTLPLSCLHMSGARPQDVYVEDLLHRDPGDPSTLAPAEAAFAPLVRAWMEAERAGAVAAAAAAAAAGGPAQGASFTRVVVSSLKPEILAQIADDEGGQQLCRRAAPAGRSLDARAAPLARMLCLQAAGRAGVCMRSGPRAAPAAAPPAGPWFRRLERTPLLPGHCGCAKGMRQRLPLGLGLTLTDAARGTRQGPGAPVPLLPARRDRQPRAAGLAARRAGGRAARHLRALRGRRARAVGRGPDQHGRRPGEPLPAGAPDRQPADDIKGTGAHASAACSLSGSAALRRMPN